LVTSNKDLVRDRLPKGENPGPVDAETYYLTIARRFGFIGNAGECARCLRKAVEGGFFCYPYMARDPDLDPVRSDPRVQEALALAKARHEEFKKKWAALVL